MTARNKEPAVSIKIARGAEGLVARLPLLGPIIGWTRRGAGASQQARLWIKADDYYSQPPAIALTVRWDKGVVPGSVRLWRIYTATLKHTHPRAKENFALADIAWGAEDSGIVRMVTIHIRHGLTRVVAPEEAVEFAVPAAVRFDEASMPGERPAGGDDDAPRPHELEFAKAFPHIKQTPEELAGELFRDLEQYIATLRRPRPPEASRPTPKERVARIELCEAALRAQRPVEEPGLRFGAGCCRHPGMSCDRELADRALDALSQRAAQGERLDLVLMLGDQIYADATAGVIDAEDRLEKYTRRYDEAFGSPGFRRLARRVPLYMAGDDHEIRDNWPKDSVPPGAEANLKALFARAEDWAWQLFLAHQRSHGPDHPRWAPKSDGVKLWYAFEAEGFPFFCFDTRFERRRDSPEMMEPYQIECFGRWLDEVCSGPMRLKPKFVLSGSVFAPAERTFAGQTEYARRADSWLGYPATRAAVMHEIVARDAQNVVFVSGDYHCGALASLHCSGASRPLRCYAVVSPPFYAPFPFANLPRQAIAPLESFTTRDKDGREVEVECRARALDVAGFALLTVEPPAAGADPLDWAIKVEFHADCWQEDAHGNDRRPGAVLACTARLARGEVQWP